MKNVDIKLGLIIFAVVVAVALMFVFLMHGIENNAISMEEQIDGAASEISVQQKRRADLIPNLVDCVKAYDKHEYETLVKIVEERNVTDDSTGESMVMEVEK